MSIALTELHKDILRVAGDNDGLWEFAFIGGTPTKNDRGVTSVSANPYAFDHLHAAAIELVLAGLVTVHDSSGALGQDEAIGVLRDPANWVPPWDEGGEPETGSDAYWAELTARGEAAIHG